MKKTDEVLRKVQGRFGQITKEKVIARLIVVLIWFIPSVVLIYIYVNLSEDGRIWMTVLVIIAIATYVVIRFRRRKIKIPIKKADEEYVAVDKPTTAEIPLSPISAEKQVNYQVHTDYQPTYRPHPPPKNLELEEVELSPFARKRIAEECYLNVRYAAFEIRKPAKELFFQLKKRLRLIEEVSEEDDDNSKTRAKTRAKREPSTTIYGELLFVIVSLFVLLLPVVASIFPLPEWAVEAYKPMKESEIAPLIILGIGGLLTIWSVFALYSKLAYWHSWRMILLLPDAGTGNPGGLVVVNKPPLLGGKVTLASLQKVNRCFISTSPSENELRGLRSLFLRILGLRWMIVDIQGNKDKDVNLMGPFKQVEAAKASRTINSLSAHIRTQERE